MPIDSVTGNNTVEQIKAAKEAGYRVPPELAMIADRIERIIASYPLGSLESVLGWSYIIALAEGNLQYPELEIGARMLVFQAINLRENRRFLEEGR